MSLFFKLNRLSFKLTKLWKLTQYNPKCNNKDHYNWSNPFSILKLVHEWCLMSPKSWQFIECKTKELQPIPDHEGVLFNSLLVSQFMSVDWHDLFYIRIYLGIHCLVGVRIITGLWLRFCFFVLWLLCLFLFFLLDGFFLRLFGNRWHF